MDKIVGLIPPVEQAARENVVDLSFFDLEGCPGYAEIIRGYLTELERINRRSGVAFDYADAARQLQGVFLEIARDESGDIRAVMQARTAQLFDGVAFDLFHSIPMGSGFNAFTVIKAIAHQYLPEDDIPKRLR